MPPFGGEHDEVERTRAFHFQPARAAISRFVRRVERFRHHAFVAARQRVGVETLCRCGVARHQPRHHQRRRQAGCERVEARVRRRIDQRLVVAPQAVEEKRGERQFGAQLRHVELAAEAAHRFLKRLGAPPGASAIASPSRTSARDGSARPLRRSPARRGDVVEVARVHAHVVSRLVHLHARAVELPFERRSAERAERVVEVARRLREHGLHRPVQLDREARQPRRAFGQRRACDRAKVAREHRGAAHVADGRRSRRRRWRRPSPLRVHPGAARRPAGGPGNPARRASRGRTASAVAPRVHPSSPCRRWRRFAPAQRPPRPTSAPVRWPRRRRATRAAPHSRCRSAPGGFRPRESDGDLDFGAGRSRAGKRRSRRAWRFGYRWRRRTATR